MTSSSNELLQFNGPERLGHFSSKNNRRNGLTYYPDKSALRHFVSPCKGKNHDVDLFSEFSDHKLWKRKPLDRLLILQWVVNNYPLERRADNPDFICNSRTLRSIMAGDSNDRPDWKIVAVKINDLIIIDEVLTKQTKINTSDKTKHPGKTPARLYTEFKFIELSTFCQDGSRSVAGRGNYRDTFHTVNRSRIGDHSLIYAHPVHCLIDKHQYEKTLDEMKFAKLSLRDCYYWNHPDRIHLWHGCEVRWWSESILSGMETIFCGEKARKNRLERVVGINAKGLSRNKPWTPNECLQRLDSTLTFIKKTVTMELIPYKFINNSKTKLITVAESDVDAEKFANRCFLTMCPKQRSFTGPNRMGYFSCKYDNLTGLFTYHADKSALRYYVSPSNGNAVVNFLEGFSQEEKWGRVPQSEMFILRWVVDNHKLVQETNPDFVCHSRILKTILSCRSSRISEWELVAIKVNNLIIIDEVDTEQRKQKLEQQKLSANENSFTGFKYIELSTRYQDDSKIIFGRGGRRDTFYTVNGSQIGTHKLLYSYGVDCLINKDDYNKSVEEMKFIILATRSCFFNSKNQKDVRHNRLARWWAESILSRNEKIFCGEKTKNNCLKQIVKIDAKKLPRNCPWTPDDCFERLDSTLSSIKKIVTKQLIPYKFKYNPDGEPIYTRLDDEPVENFIPDWFIYHQGL